MASVSARGSATASQKRRASQAFETIPAFPNAFPYNELLLRGVLKLGDCWVKTRSWAWKHCGPTFLYTSSRVHRPAAEAYGLDPKEFPRGMIVGMADLVEVRWLTAKEQRLMVARFNNVSLRGVKGLETKFWKDGTDYIEPLPVGYFFRNVRRLRKPVPFAWPRGAITVAHVPVAHVTAALKRAGI